MPSYSDEFAKTLKLLAALKSGQQAVTPPPPLPPPLPAQQSQTQQGGFSMPSMSGMPGGSMYDPGGMFGAGGLFSSGSLGPASASNMPSGFGLMDTGGIGAAPIGGESAASAGGMGALALPAMFAALIGGGKLIENNNPDSWYGRALLSGLGPSGKQVMADPKLAFLGPFAGAFRNEEAANAKPEWSGLVGK